MDWTKGEKRKAREIYEKGRLRELHALVEQFKTDVSTLHSSDDDSIDKMWEIVHTLAKKQTLLERKFHFTESRIEEILGRMIVEEWISENEIDSLDQIYRDQIHRWAEILRSDR